MKLGFSKNSESSEQGQDTEILIFYVFELLLKVGKNWEKKIDKS